MNRTIGTVVRGVRAPIFREGDDVVSGVAETVLTALRENGIEPRDKDVVAVTESVVARCQGNYATTEQIAADVRAKTGAVRMAAVSGAPVVPVFVTRNRTPFCPVRVIFGEPYPIANIDPEDHTACQQAADALLKTIYQLGGDAYADQIGKDSGVLLRC